MHSQLTAQLHGLCGKKWLGGGPYPGHVENSSWVGGAGYDGLEEAYTYWLNGALPLSILLQDDDNGGLLLEEIEYGIDYVFDMARENDGWLGPKINDSPWSSFRFCTAITTYIDAFDSTPTGAAADITTDPKRTKRAKRAVLTMFQHASSLLEYLKSSPLAPGSWEHARWVELLEAYAYLMSSKHWSASDQGQQDVVINLLTVAQQQGFDWLAWLESNESNPFVNSSDSSIRGWFPSNTADSDAIGENRWLPTVDRQWTHGVNLAQALQVYALLYRLDSTNDTTWLDRGRDAFDRVMDLHGQSTGVFTADENLAGREANRGTETCAVVELMNSAFNSFSISGDVRYLDQVELVAYNALPAAFFNGTMWSLNYYQQVNKIDAMQYPPNCEDDARPCQYCFGLLFECCVSNHVQGWPKFVMRQVQISAEGHVAITQYFSAHTTRSIELSDGTTIGSLRVATEYPFSQMIDIEINKVSQEFVLELRIPGWCGDARIELDGRMMPETVSRGTMHALKIPAGSHAISLLLPMKIRIERRPPNLPFPGVAVPTNAATILRGPLVYAMPREYVLDVGMVFDNEDSNSPVGQAQGQNSYLLGTGPWRYALVIEEDTNADADLKHQYHPPSPLPHGQGPFAESLVPDRIIAKATLLPREEWDVQRSGRGHVVECATGSTSIDHYNTSWAGPLPRSPVSSAERVPQYIELIPYGATNLRIAEFVTTRGFCKKEKR